jgi:hypothetical protein
MREQAIEDLYLQVMLDCAHEPGAFPGMGSAGLSTP